MADDADDKQSKWHVEKGVPAALIFTMLCQTIAVVWWASGINQRVTELERNAVAAVPRLETVIKLDTKVDMLQAGLTEIKSALTTMVATQKDRK